MMFSVIIPCHNRENTISRTIKSVIGQSFPDWEMIVVDDGSSDNTKQVVETYLNDQRIRFLSQNKAGVSAARNLGARNSHGAYLTFLDSDDEVTESWLFDFQEIIQAAADPVGYVSCGYLLNGKEFSPKTTPDICPHPYLSLAGTFTVNKEIFEKAGGYDEALRQSENWEMGARALEQCLESGALILVTENKNFIWHHSKTSRQVTARDLARAESLLHLFYKYAGGGILHGRRERFLTGSAINFARAGKICTSGRLLLLNLWKFPSLKAAARIICLLVPPLRRRLWLRNRRASKTP